MHTFNTIVGLRVLVINGLLKMCLVSVVSHDHGFSALICIVSHYLSSCFCPEGEKEG